MIWSADELFAPGGPSVPVWAFLSTLTVGVGAIIQQVISLKARTREAQDEARKAAESATTAAENTRSVSNGFAGRVDTKLDSIIEAQRATDAALREHLRWHLDRSD